jgi:replicative superfamily II helicase
MKVIHLKARRELLDAWSKDLPDDLTQVQVAAVEAGVLEARQNLLVVAPTSSGKTLVGEMAAASLAFEASGRYSIMGVPTKALAEEHFNRFRERYRDVLNVVISTGDWTEFDEDVRHGNFDLAVMTYEKLAILVGQAAGVLDRCGCVIVDEGQSLNEPDRGVGLEILITQLLVHPAKPRLVVLSASLSELNGFDRWLQAVPIVVTERPVPLDEAVCSIDTGTAIFRSHEGGVDRIQLAKPTQDAEVMALNLALSYVADDKQVVIFRTSIAGTERLASQLAAHLPAGTAPQEWVDRLAGLEDADSSRALLPLFSAKVALHNADLGYDERRLIEDAFRARYLKVIVATETLAMGVNLPTDVVILVETERYGWRQGWTSTPIQVAAYRNMAGRAGRLGLGARGLAILIAKDSIRARQVFDHYVVGDVEPMKSALPSHRMTDVAYRLLAAGIVRDPNTLVSFFAATYAYATFYESHGGMAGIEGALGAAVKEAVGTGLLVEHDTKIHPTPIGRALARSGVVLGTAVRLKGLVDRLHIAEVTTSEVLFQICQCEESGIRPYIPRKASDPRATLHTALIASAPTSEVDLAMRAPAIDEETLQALIESSCTLEWIEGSPARTLVKRYQGLSAERLRTMGASLAWLLESLVAAARAAAVPADRVMAIGRLALASRYGLPHQLAPLARLRVGIRRETLLALDEIGLADPDDVLEASVEVVAKVLSPIELARLQRAIRDDTVETFRRRKSSHLQRAARSGLSPQLIDALYSAEDDSLEKVVRDALELSGLPTTRLETQAYGEEDLQISTAAGIVVSSVTASKSVDKPIPWRKARQVLGQGAGLNPVNFTCFGRPRFDGLAERSAAALAREEHDRRLLLIPMDIFVEAISRVAEGRLPSEALGNVLASKRGLLTSDDLLIDDDR